MPIPVFGPDQIDQNPNSVSISTNPNSSVDPYWSNYFANGANSVRPAVGLNTANADAARTWQQQLIQDLQQAAAGNPASRSQQSLSQGYTEARAGQSALGSSSRGTGGGAGLRAGAMGAGNVQRGFEGDKAMLMEQEKAAAQQLLAQQLAQQRALDGAQAQGMATNAMGNQSLDDAMRQFYLDQGLGLSASAADRGVESARTALGLNERRNAIGDRTATNAINAGATGVASLAPFLRSSGGSGYRQVDGTDSIVPEWDK